MRKCYFEVISQSKSPVRKVSLASTSRAFCACSSASFAWPRLLFCFISRILRTFAASLPALAGVSCDRRHDLSRAGRGEPQGFSGEPHPECLFQRLLTARLVNDWHAWDTSLRF